MTASVIISAIALTLLAATSISIAVIVSRALSSAFLALDKMNDRWAIQQERLLDRFQAIDWEHLAVLRSTQDSSNDEGGFFPPIEEEDGVTEIEEPGRWGSLSRLRERARLTDEEGELLEEDFDEAGEPRR